MHYRAITNNQQDCHSHDTTSVLHIMRGWFSYSGEIILILWNESVELKISVWICTSVCKWITPTKRPKCVKAWSEQHTGNKNCSTITEGSFILLFQYFVPHIHTDTRTHTHTHKQKKHPYICTRTNSSNPQRSCWEIHSGYILKEERNRLTHKQANKRGNKKVQHLLVFCWQQGWGGINTEGTATCYFL